MSTSISNSSLTEVTLNVTSGTPPVNVGTQTIPVSSLSVGANSVKITDSSILDTIGSGTTINYSLSCSYANGKSVVSTAGTPYVPPPPPPPVAKASNGVTNKYTLSSIPLGQPNPYIIQQDGIYYAIMSNSSDSINKITAYANNTNNAPFIPNGQSSAVPFSNIVTTLMTDMSNMFYNAAYFNQNLSTWDTSNVTNMTKMFYSAHSFNNGDNIPILGNTNSGIGYWNTSKVTHMTEVFYAAQNFNRDIGSWDVSSVNNMDRMFGFAYHFNNGNNIPSIGSWQTLNVQSMAATFYSASSFNRNISGWNVSGLLQNPMPNFSVGSGLNSNTIPDF
jgi:surface protein